MSSGPLNYLLERPTSQTTTISRNWAGQTQKRHHKGDGSPSPASCMQFCPKCTWPRERHVVAGRDQGLGGSLYAAVRASSLRLGADLPVWRLTTAPHPCSSRTPNQASGPQVNFGRMYLSLLLGPWEEVDIVYNSPEEEILETLPCVCLH